MPANGRWDLMRRLKVKYLTKADTVAVQYHVSHEHENICKIIGLMKNGGHISVFQKIEGTRGYRVSSLPF